MSCYLNKLFCILGIYFSKSNIDLLGPGQHSDIVCNAYIVGTVDIFYIVELPLGIKDNTPLLKVELGPLKPHLPGNYP